MEEIMKNLNYQPSKLTGHELTNPFTVITDFFDNNALHEVREKLWELYTGWVNSSYDFAEGKENADMLSLYTQLINVLNATYIANETNKTKN
ncbi:hypothetical protein [Pedobacter nyackensis]|uniref:hypothetical protein n=1 Tax=Pedobacter nyackensis TaxID=475255 RepID=UPI002930441C|nr:hypothetical protein [Pedobacter nyackensis]